MRLHERALTNRLQQTARLSLGCISGVSGAALHNPLGTNTKAVVFDVGGVLIDLHTEGARRELIEKYGFVSQNFARLTRSSFESHPRSITELAMIGSVGTSEYLDAFLHECGIKDLEALRLNRLSVVGQVRETGEGIFFVCSARSEHPDVGVLACR